MMETRFIHIWAFYPSPPARGVFSLCTANYSPLPSTLSGKFEHPLSLSELHYLPPKNIYHDLFITSLLVILALSHIHKFSIILLNFQYFEIHVKQMKCRYSLVICFLSQLAMMPYLTQAYLLETHYINVYRYTSFIFTAASGQLYITKLTSKMILPIKNTPTKNIWEFLLLIYSLKPLK